VVFFLLLISIFSLLLVSTVDKYRFIDEKRNFSTKIYDLLATNGLVSKGIQVYENEILSPQEAVEMKLLAIGMVRKMKIRTFKQDVKDIYFIVSSDGEEIIKVLNVRKK
jgi:hypothetical protein